MKKLLLLVLLFVAVACVPQARPLLVYKASVQQIQDVLIAKGLQTQASVAHNYYSPVAIGDTFLTLEATPLTAVSLFAPVSKVRLAWTFVKRGEGMTALAVDAECGRSQNCSNFVQAFLNELTIKFSVTAW